MNDLAYDPDEPIVALATAWGESALAVVRTSGAGSIDRVAEIFSRPSALREAAGNTLHHGRLLDNGEVVDEVIVSVFRAPASYTGQESVEIACHGSIPGITRVVSLLKAHGFRDAGPGEFTLRAFLNRKMDLTQAEAVREIVSSRTARAHALALHRLGGAVHDRIDSAKQRITKLASTIEIGLDYPEEEVPGEIADALPDLRSIRGELAALVDTYRTGKLYQEGVRVALCGRTNAGKSSLFNLFAREERSIVSEVHGTTRDYIEAWVVIEGIPMNLYDTAGLRSSLDPVEAEGIRRSEQIIEHADIIVYIVDAETGLTPQDGPFLDRHQCIRVWNKVDLAATQEPAGFIRVSAATGEGFDRLQRALLDEAAKGGPAASGQVVIDSLRQKELLDRCVAALDHIAEGIDEGMPGDAVALDVREALDCLGEITGEVTSADILNTMFAGFCVGK